MGAGIEKFAKKTADDPAHLRTPMLRRDIVLEFSQLTQLLGMAFCLLELPSNEPENTLACKN